MKTILKMLGRTHSEQRAIESAIMVGLTALIAGAIFAVAMAAVNH